MMSYELFKKVVEERIMEYLPQWFHEYSVNIDTRHKVNKECDFLSIVPNKKMGAAFACPAIPLSEVYKCFQENEDIDVILHYISEIIVNNSAQLNEKDFSLALENHKDKIVMNIVNREKNQAMLKRIPHRDILDFSIFYRFILQKEAGGYGTVVVNNDLMKRLKINEVDLFDMALENTKRIFPFSVKAMGERFFIISNKDNLHGSSYMAHADVLKEIYEKTEGNYYIIPTSVHEFIAVGTKYVSLPIVKDMLQNGNEEVCGEGEFLSGNVYFYDGKINQLKIA